MVKNEHFLEPKERIGSEVNGLMLATDSLPPIVTVEGLYAKMIARHGFNFKLFVRLTIWKNENIWEKRELTTSLESGVFEKLW